MDNGSQKTLTIDRMPEGGFVVVAGGRQDCFREPVFACSDIDAALAFIREKVKPIPPVQGEIRGNTVVACGAGIQIR